jgi:hypothetical protein
MALRRDQNVVIEVVPLVPAIRRFVVTGNELRAEMESAVDSALPLRSGFVDGRYRFGYADYFVSVTYGPEHRRAVATTSGAS